ncbi:unnamed protein product, partial [Pneumocystis jirovecii]
MKNVTFATINDGTTGKSLQTVLRPEQAKRLSIGCSVKLTGSYIKAQGGSKEKQEYELHVNNVHVYGYADPSSYPLQKKNHTAEFLRKKPHLRLRTESMSKLLRLRSFLISTISLFFSDRNYIQTHPPILTSSDCEGAGKIFLAKTEDGLTDFFKKPVYLTVSTQLHLEALAHSLSKVWSLSPIFRAEESQTSKHLAEFYMLEAEISFIDNLEELISVIEQMIYHSVENLRNSSIGQELVSKSYKISTKNQTNLEDRWNFLLKKHMEDSEEPKIEETEQFKDHSTLFYDPYEKKDNNLVSDEEKDDLFGDHTDDEKNNDIKSKEIIEEIQGEAQEEPEYQETRKILESTLVNRAVPESTDGEVFARHYCYVLIGIQLYYVKMPNFLTIVQKPFDRESYLEEAQSEREETTIHQYDTNQRIRLKVENTIRWRYVKNKDGTYVDGSLSLLLGSELFSAVTKNSFSEHTYLCLSHESQNLLMSRKRFTKNMTFLPIDTGSSTHKRLTEAILRGNMKKCSIVEFVNVEDPEKVKREAERIEEEKIRFRRRLETKRRAQDAKYYEVPILTVEGLEAEEVGEHFSKTSYIDKDDDDDFIVDDESDETEKLERLRKIKEDGINMYKKQQLSSDKNEQNKENDDESNHSFTEQDTDDDDDDTFIKETDADKQIS